MLQLPKHVILFMDTFKKNGFQIFVVGGAVRDLLLDLPTENWDFTTNAKPEEILKLFPTGVYNNKYGTVIIAHPQKPDQKLPMPFEVTTFRRESDYSDNRHPEKITWAKTVDEDLGRRDFTINAMAYDGEKITDLFNGQKHLKEKLIVAVGEPVKRFAEDSLRLMRAVRFAAELGFMIDDNTRAAIQKNAASIANVSQERIRDELLKIIASDHPSDGILFLRNTGLLTFILPELDICFIIPQKSPKRHHIYDVGTHLVMALKHCPSKDLITKFAALLHDIGKAKTFRRDEKTGLITFYNHEVVGTKQVVKIAQRLRLSNAQSEKLVRLVQYHQFTVTEIQTDKAVRRFIREVGKEYLQDILDVRTADRIGSGATPTSWRLDLFKKRLIEVQKKPFSVTDLKIDGTEVMKTLKIKPGPKVGEILKKLFDEVVDGKLKNEKPVLTAKLADFKE